MKMTGKFLLIDDDPDFLKLLGTLLNVDGHSVSLATNWKQVAASLNLALQSNIPFDLIFLDLMMPERSGFDILRALKVVLFPLPPVFVLTALDDPDNSIRAEELGVSRFFTKPVARDILLGAVQEILQGDQTAGL